MRHPIVRLALVLGLVLTKACIPYTVGTTAATVPVGERTKTTSYYFIPNGLKQPEDTMGAPISGMDHEWRFGVGPRSDVGFRIPPGGAVVNYKSRVADAAPGQPAVAYMVGGGLVNWGEHLHLEATLIASGDPLATLTPFGGARAMQVVPITTGAVKDSPSLGLFGGAQISGGGMTLRPELGIYYDRSALKMRQGNVIFVPAVTVQRRRRERSDLGLRPKGVAMGAGGKEPARQVGGNVRCTRVLCGSVPGPWRAPVVVPSGGGTP